MVFSARRTSTLRFVTVLMAGLLLGTSPVEAEGNKNLSKSYEIYITRAISNEQILPTTFLIKGATANEIVITACRGEYAFASFVITTLNNLKEVTVAVTDLKSQKNSILSNAIDIRVVKCSY